MHHPPANLHIYINKSFHRKDSPQKILNQPPFLVIFTIFSRDVPYLEPDGALFVRPGEDSGSGRHGGSVPGASEARRTAVRSQGPHQGCHDKNGRRQARVGSSVQVLAPEHCGGIRH